MRIQDYIGKDLPHVMEEINYDIDLLYACTSVNTRYMILNHLKEKISYLEAFLNLKDIQEELPANNNEALEMQEDGFPEISVSTVSDNQMSFTLEELTTYNGKAGNPAYVAIKGIVYDVTENAAWGAATHFGLSAGRDLTNEFFACHTDQSILSGLKEVGRLVEDDYES